MNLRWTNARIKNSDLLYTSHMVIDQVKKRIRFYFQILSSV